MKKLTRRSFTAAGILAALGVGGVFVSSSNLIGCVYGPPPEEYDPDLNEIEDVYGPPPMDEDEDVDDESVEDGEDDGDYDPEENIPVAVYGPPEDFEPIAAPSGEEPSE